MLSRFAPRQRRAIWTFGLLCALALAFLVLNGWVNG